MQRGGWQVGTSYAPSKVKGVADPIIKAAAAAIAEQIAITLNRSVRMLKKNRALEGDLYLNGTSTLAFRWTAVQSNEPYVLDYWAKLKYKLTLIDVHANDATSVITLVFKKKMNKVGVGIVAASVAVGVTG